jgi:hypothetical protein
LPAARALSSIYSNLVTLAASDNPTTITQSGLLNGGLYGAGIAAPWTIANLGGILGVGMTLTSAGTAANSGTILSKPASMVSGRIPVVATVSHVNTVTRGYAAIYDNAPLTVVNAGRIQCWPYGTVQAMGRASQPVRPQASGPDFLHWLNLFQQC